MACTINKRQIVTVDGSSKIFGGVLAGLTLNLGSASQKSSGTISVIRREDGAFNVPAPFTEVSVGIGDASFAMLVKGHSVSQSAAGADSLKVEVVDKSHEWLDLNYLILNEANRQGGGVEYQEFEVGALGVYALGTKWMEKTTEDMFGNILPVADGQWMKARDYWEGKQFLALHGLGVMKPMTQLQLDDRIINQSGEILYDARDAFNLLKIDMPNNVNGDEKLKFMGTFRQVLESLANYYGFFYWWDMESNKVETDSKIDLDEGEAILSKIEGNCRVTAKGSSEDAGSTYAKSVFSQFSNSWTWSSKAGSSAGRGIRYMSASLLGSKFKFRTCHQGGDVKASSLAEFGSDAEGDSPAQTVTFDQSRAMAAAVMGPKVYAAYVIQSLVVDNNKVKIPAMNREVTVTNGAKMILAKDLGDDGMLALDGWGYLGEAPENNNEFLVDLYKPSALADCGDDPECACLWPLKTRGESGETNPIGAAMTSWMQQQKTDEMKARGFTVNEQMKNSINFQCFLRKDGTGSTLFEGDGVDASKDPMYGYLAAIPKFINRFYVVRRGGNEPHDNYWVAQAGIKRNYNYWVSTSSQPKMVPGSNGSLRSVHPALRLDESGVTEFIDLFKALEYVYTGNTGDDRIDPAQYPPILDFTYWMDRAPSRLAAYFSDPGGARFSCTAVERANISGQTNQPQMHFVVLGDTDKGGTPSDEDIAAANSIFLASGDLSKDVELFKGNQDCSIYVGNTHFIGDKIKGLTEAELRVDAPNKIKCQYDTTTGAGKDGTNMKEPFNFFCNWLAIPRLGENKVFNSQFETTEVTATELGLSNTEHAEFGSLIASPFSATNKLIMANLNKTKAETQTFFDALPARSQRISFILLEGDEVQLPSPNEGLEGLSISVGEQTTVEVSCGNQNAKRVAMNMFTNKLNTAFNSYASQAFGSSVPQLSNALRFLGIGQQ